VEKAFDEFKNKHGETKSWGSSANAKTCQARLLCLTHNLMTLMEEKIFRETGIPNQAETQREAKTLAKREEQSKSKSGDALTVLQRCGLRSPPSELRDHRARRALLLCSGFFGDLQHVVVDIERDSDVYCAIASSHHVKFADMLLAHQT
jgi:hypothetical protein